MQHSHLTSRGPRRRARVLVPLALATCAAVGLLPAAPAAATLEGDISGASSQSDPANDQLIRSGYRRTIWTTQDGHMVVSLYSIRLSNGGTSTAKESCAGFYWSASKKRWVIGARGYKTLAMNTTSPSGVILLSGLSNGTQFVIGCKGAADRKLNGLLWNNPLLG